MDESNSTTTPELALATNAVRPAMQQQDASAVSSVAILLNLLMLPAAAATASCGSYLLFFGAYAWIVAFLSLICAVVLRQKTVEAIRAGGGADSRNRFNYRLVILGNLLTLPVAAATAVFDHDLLVFGVFACIVALLSLRCAFLLKARITEATRTSGTASLSRGASGEAEGGK